MFFQRTTDNYGPHTLVTKVRTTFCFYNSLFSRSRVILIPINQHQHGVYGRVYCKILHCGLWIVICANRIKKSAKQMLI